MWTESVNKTLIRLIFEEPLEEYVVLDVGCGAGALSFLIADRAKRVIGIDISEEAVDLARKNSRANTEFFIMDADRSDYRELGRIDMVVSHLFMSKEMIERGHLALPRGGPLAFACFHSEHLIEGGRRSRFSYTEDEMRALLKATGFETEYLEVERTTLPFNTREDAIEILGKRKTEVWRVDGRLDNLLSYIESGGRSLTKSTLVGKAKKG